MSYSVNWEPEAEQELARIWMAAADPNAVTAASDEIDLRLKRDPHSQGESRDGDYRILFVPPLGVYFEVDRQRQEVSVQTVWLLASG